LKRLHGSLPTVRSRRKGRGHVTVTLQALAELVQGELIGDGQLVISAARTLQEAGTGDITFVEDDKHAHLLHQSRASAAVVLASVSANGLPLIKVADPLSAFVIIVRHLQGRAEPAPHGIDPRAFVHPTAVVGEGASVLPFATIGEGTVIGSRCRVHSGVAVGPHCRIGDDVTIYANAVLYEGTVLGNRVIVHANAVLGADGFGYRF